MDSDSDMSFLSEKPAKKKNVTATGYVIPQYDFDQVEESEGPPDVDEVKCMCGGGGGGGGGCVMLMLFWGTGWGQGCK
jgi:hypothetical protein